MKISKTVYIIFAIIVLMIARFFGPGGSWLLSITLFGLFISWIDITLSVWNNHKSILSLKEKSRAFLVLSFMISVGLLPLLLAILNLVLPLDCLDKMLIADESTLLTLLFCLEKDTFSKLFIALIEH